jgi:multicomponent Na+:H+ antiporter subunit B
MPERLRIRIFLPFAALFFGLYCYAAAGLPLWGSFHGPYGEYVARMAVYERHATDTVNAINYDYRGFDTLGEEFILFTAVLGVMLLLRRDEKSSVSGKVQDRAVLSPTVQAVALPIAGLTVVFGLYIGLHGQLTPGGGFQGGVILATAPVLVYISQNTAAFTRFTAHRLVEALEAAGAGAYAVIGIVPLLAGLPFLTNVVPLGTTGQVFSSGTIAVISATVGFEVTAAFLLVVYTYLQEIIAGGVPED